MPLGVATQEEPLVVDPIQAVLVLELCQTASPTQLLFIVRTNALIEHRCPVRKDSFIPWEEWGQGSVVMEIPLEGVRLSTFVDGTHVVIAIFGVNGNDSGRLYTFDFSKWGYSALPLWSGEKSIDVKRSTFKDGRKLMLERVQGMNPQKMLFG